MNAMSEHQIRKDIDHIYDELHKEVEELKSRVSELEKQVNG